MEHFLNMSSSLHWLNLGFLYAVFVQWNILPTKLSSFTSPSSNFPHYECSNYAFLCSNTMFLCISHSHSIVWKSKIWAQIKSMETTCQMWKFFFSWLCNCITVFFLLSKFWSCQQVRFSNIYIFLRIVFNFNHTPISTNSLGSPSHQILYCGLSNWHFQAQF